MENEPAPGGDNQGDGMAFLWLLVGLAPILILLSVLKPGGFRPDPLILFLVCTACNLLGGFGCVGKTKDPVSRVVFGMLLSFLFFVLCWGIVLLQACSHMNI